MKLEGVIYCVLRNKCNAYPLHSAIEKIEHGFDIILIMEFMMESLLILKDKLGWDKLDDIAFIVMNANRGNGQKNTDEKNTRTAEKIHENSKIVAFQLIKRSDSFF